jgi:hypothetical protein
MPQYRFPKKVLNGRLLRDQLTAQGLPGDRVRFSLEDDTVVVDVDEPPLSATEEAQLTTIIASHDAAQRTSEQQAADALAASDEADLAQITGLAGRDPATLSDQEARGLLLRLARRELRRTRQERVGIPTTG